MAGARVFTGGPPYAHDFAATGAEMVAITEEAGLDVRAVFDDVEAVAPALGDTDVLVVNALRWRMLDERYAPWRTEWAASASVPTRAAIEAFVASGGGLVATHTAVICFDDWPEWGRLLGATWVWGRSHHPPLGPVQARLDSSTEHPLVAGLGPHFDLVDEVYADLALSDDILVLAVARAAGGEDEWPVAWIREHGRGRVAYVGLGHDVASLRHPTHRELLRRAMRWCTPAVGSDRFSTGAAACAGSRHDRRAGGKV